MIPGISFSCVREGHHNSCESTVTHAHTRTHADPYRMFEAVRAGSVVLGKDGLNVQNRVWKRLDFVVCEKKKKKPHLPPQQCAALVISAQGYVHIFLGKASLCPEVCNIAAVSPGMKNVTSVVWRGREVSIWNMNRPGHFKDVFALSCVAELIHSQVIAAGNTYE